MSVPVNKRYGGGCALDYGHDDFAEDENAETLPYVVECRVHKTVCNYKTLAEAQALVDAAVAADQAAYDALPADDPRKIEGHPAYQSRATDITLTE